MWAAFKDQSEFKGIMDRVRGIPDIQDPCLSWMGENVHHPPPPPPVYTKPPVHTKSTPSPTPDSRLQNTIFTSYLCNTYSFQ